MSKAPFATASLVFASLALVCSASIYIAFATYVGGHFVEIPFVYGTPALWTTSVALTIAGIVKIGGLTWTTAACWTMLSAAGVNWGFWLWIMSQGIC